MTEFGLRKLKESFPSEIDFRKFLREAIIRHQPREEWNAKGVADYIMVCRQSEGIPMFRTGYGGEDFEVGGSKAVMATCWSGTDPKSKLFVGVPEDIFTEMKMRSGDWHFLLTRYSKERYAEAVKYPVRIK